MADLSRLRWAVPIAAAVLLSGCSPGTSLEDSLPPHPAVPAYHRSEFGTGWARVGHCTTRQIVLERDAGPAAVDTDGDGCRDNGPILDLYTGNIITPQQAQIDHVYSLEQAWVGGAWAWPPERRRAFSQDTRNLRAVTASANEAKGDAGPGRWQPPNQAALCQFAMIYEDTAKTWGLPVRPDDATALQRMLGTCPNTGGTP